MNHRPPCPSPTPRVYPNSCALSRWPSSHLILCCPLLLLTPIPTSIRVSSHEVAKVLEFQLQHHFLKRNPRAVLLQNGLVRSPCSPRDSQEPSPTPQFKINYTSIKISKNLQIIKKKHEIMKVLIDLVVGIFS